MKTPTYSVINAACTRCGARDGDRCRTRTGRTVYRPHAVRKSTWCATAVPWALARWNEAHPVGTPVTAYPGARPEVAPGGSVVTGRTTSKAWVLSGHTPVVMVSGHGAAIALAHIDPR